MTAPTQQQPPSGGMSPEQLAVILTLVQAQGAMRQTLTNAAVAAAVAAFTGFHDWWSPDAVKHQIEQALRVIQPAQRQAAQFTDAYLTRAARTMTGRPQIQPGGAIDIAQLRRVIPTPLAEDLAAGRVHVPYVVLGDTHDGPGADIDKAVKLVVADAKKVEWLPAAEPYGRIADQFRYAVIAQGNTEEAAEQKALIRIAVAAENDVTMAVRAQYHKTMGQQKADGFRRILHPELSKSGPCGLCVVAADRKYRREDLMPLHARCVCEVLPIYGKLDPGISLNWSDLRALYDAAGGTGKETLGKDGRMHSAELKKLRVALTENGETGPVLVNADQKYRGPAQVAKTQVPDRAVRAKAQLAALEKSLETLQLRDLAGENVTKPLRWQTDKVDELRKELGLAGAAAR